MGKGYGFFSVFMMLVFAVSGQPTTGSITGRVLNAQSEPVIANVILLTADSNKLMKTELPDEQGSFVLDGLVGGQYIVKVIAPGFSEYTSDKVRVGSKDEQLPDIVLSKVSKDLKEVTVSAQKPLIEIKADRVIVNVENSIVNTGSSVLEVLGRAPGVKVDQSDNISLKGKPGVTIMMDGKRVPVAGADLANLLKGMPASTIDKIEIITNPGARYDAAGSGGIINIKTKKDKRMGTNGSVTGSYSQGVYPKGNAGFNMNYRNKKLNVNAGYNYSNRKGFSELLITRRFYTDNVLRTTYTQDNNLIFPVSNHMANASIDYNLTSKTVIGAMASGNSSRFKPAGDNSSRVDSGGTNTYFTTSNRSDDAWDNYAVNAFVKHTFDTTGRELNVDLDYARYWNQTYQLFTNKYYNANNDPMLADYLIYGDLAGITQIRSLKADYTHPLKDGTRLEAGLKLSYVTADNNPAYYDVSTGDTIYDPTKTNHFIYNEHINAAYINGSKDIGKKWSVQVGLRAEQTIADGLQKVTGEKLNRNYTQLFPSIATQWHLHSKHDLGITLSRRIDRPSYKQLNPFKFFLDPTNFRVGNPLLKPALTYSFELSHTYKQRFLTTVGYSITSDVITEVLQPNPERQNESFQIDRNLARMYSYSFSVAYPFQVTKWWSNVTNANAYYTTFSGYLANTTLQKSAPAFDLNTTNSFILPKDFSLELSCYYQSRQIWGYYDLNSLWVLNFGIQKNFFKKKLTTKLAANDIFWTGNPSADIRFRDFGETFKSRRDSRIITLSVTYRFGKNSGGQSRRRGGAEDEKRRAAGGGG